MNPDDAIAAHLAWKHALREAVRTGAAVNLDPAALDRPDRCELGLWLEGPLACFEGDGQLRELHRQFHLLAAELVRRLQVGGRPESLASLERQLEDLSTRMVTRLGVRTAAGTRLGA